MPEMHTKVIQNQESSTVDQNLYTKDKIIDQRKDKQFIKKLRRTVTSAEREVLEKYEN